MFKRTKSEPETVAETAAKVGGKGRPTPTRKEAEAAAKARAKTPRTRKEMAQQERRQRADATQKRREAMLTGDDRHLPLRDKGPVKRFVRDFVDARFSIVEMLIPLLVISLVLGWSGKSALVSASSMVLMITVLFVIIDLSIVVFRLRRQLKKRFPDQSLRGTSSYAVMRSMQMKFMRLPKSRVKVGQKLPDDYSK
ncbi:MAG: DUF3043 domain-containing protein [Nocardioidaceae bacterium]|nr:DUF3043 domain-containing protein [Nocardioidaceae bacterium]MCL2614350.1 DUF3043 domain-containing protein [Nocardioidaceae bacterium]